VQPLILFVDDDADILDGFRRMQRPYSGEWRMHFTRSPADAWQLPQEHPVDAIISDVRP
jgi:hypothetical protein